MNDEMRPRDFHRVERDLKAEINYSPCCECPSRSASYCSFYGITLKEDIPGIYIPCADCEDDFNEENRVAPLTKTTETFEPSGKLNAPKKEYSLDNVIWFKPSK